MFNWLLSSFIISELCHLASLKDRIPTIPTRKKQKAKVNWSTTSKIIHHGFLINQKPKTKIKVESKPWNGSTNSYTKFSATLDLHQSVHWDNNLGGRSLPYLLSTLLLLLCEGHCVCRSVIAIYVSKSLSGLRHLWTHFFQKDWRWYAMCCGLGDGKSHFYPSFTVVLFWMLGCRSGGHRNAAGEVNFSEEMVVRAFAWSSLRGLLWEY